MARTNIAAQTLVGPYPTLPITPGGADFSWTASDVANGNMTPLVNLKTLLIARNTGLSARTVTIASVPDTLNRTGDITAYSVAAGKTAHFGPFASTGWASSGKLNFDGAHAELEFAVVTLP